MNFLNLGLGDDTEGVKVSRVQEVGQVGVLALGYVDVVDLVGPGEAHGVWEPAVGIDYLLNTGCSDGPLARIPLGVALIAGRDADTFR